MSQREPIPIGSKIRDNDPRVTYDRVLTVTGTLPFGVVAKDSNGRSYTILRRRIFTDGKPRRSGFSLVP